MVENKNPYKATTKDVEKLFKDYIKDNGVTKCKNEVYLKNISGWFSRISQVND